MPKDNPETLTFMDLPDDVLKIIYDMLDPLDKIQWTQVCRRLHSPETFPVTGEMLQPLATKLWRKIFLELLLNSSLKTEIIEAASSQPQQFPIYLQKIFKENANYVYRLFHQKIKPISYYRLTPDEATAIRILGLPQNFRQQRLRPGEEDSLIRKLSLLQYRAFTTILLVIKKPTNENIAELNMLLEKIAREQAAPIVTAPAIQPRIATSVEEISEAPTPTTAPHRRLPHHCNQHTIPIITLIIMIIFSGILLGAFFNPSKKALGGEIGMMIILFLLLVLTIMLIRKWRKDEKVRLALSAHSERRPLLDEHRI